MKLRVRINKAGIVTITTTLAEAHAFLAHDRIMQGRPLPFIDGPRKPSDRNSDVECYRGMSIGDLLALSGIRAEAIVRHGRRRDELTARGGVGRGLQPVKVRMGHGLAC